MAKLVRDKIPDRIKNDHCVPITHIASEEEYWKGLKEKLQEEIKEFCDDESMEEMSDILEVIYAMCDFKGFDRKDLEELRKKKVQERGAFKKRIILDEIK